MLRTSLGPLKLRYPVLSSSRPLSFRSSSIKYGTLTRRAVARTTLFTFTLTSAFLATSIYADSDSDAEDKKKDHLTSLGSLVRAYTVYSLCSVPGLVDASPTILSALSSVPGIKQITEAFVRVTFFNQFVGADSAEEALPLIHSLRAANRGVLFAYSVEVDENEATGGSASLSPSSTDSSVDSSTTTLPSVSTPVDDAQSKRIVDELLHCIDVSADFEAGLSKHANAHSTTSQRHVPADTAAGGRGGRTWVAVKMTALLPDAHALIAWSSHIITSRKALTSPEGSVAFPGAPRMEDMAVISDAESHPSRLTPTQIRHIRDLYANLSRICKRAKERGVKVIVDAEYSWYQPAIDALTLALMREFNSLDKTSVTEGHVQPLVYGTFQAYLRRTPAHLALALDDARKNNYALGVKLVRGAYHPHELTAHEAALEFDNARGLSHDTTVTAPRPSLSISPDVLPPVWSEKRDTDEAYHQCVGMLIKAVKKDVSRRVDVISGSDAPGWKKGWLSGLLSASKDPAVKSKSAPGIGVLFGTHNWDSCALILRELLQNGLAVEDHEAPSPRTGVGRLEQVPIRVGDAITDRVAIGQLYGMSDDLTDWVVQRINSNTPFVIKHVPYGTLADVMPYLSRRAIENKSMLGDGNAERERQRAGREIWRKVFG